MKYRNNVKFTRSWISDEEFFNSDELPGETWKEFNTVRGITLSCKHQVSSKGRVRRLTGEFNKGTIDCDGYHEMHFSVPNSCGIEARVHNIVLTTFQGPPPAGMINPTVQHINHDKLDNRIENLCWMSAFDNNQEGHGRRVKLIDEHGEHIFASQKVASEFIGRYEDYISECIREGYKITRSSDNQELKVYTESDSNTWTLYERPQPRNRNGCRLIISNKSIDFESYQECDRFLNKPSGYTGTHVANSWPLLRTDHKFYLFDLDSREYKLYCPTKQKRKNYSNRCSITRKDDTQIFDSISAAARYIGKDSEYLRINIQKHKPIVDCSGNLVEAALIEED